MRCDGSNSCSPGRLDSKTSVTICSASKKSAVRKGITGGRGVRLKGGVRIKVSAILQPFFRSVCLEISNLEGL